MRFLKVHRALCEKGNPTLRTLMGILKALKLNPDFTKGD